MKNSTSLPKSGFYALLAVFQACHRSGRGLSRFLWPYLLLAGVRHPPVSIAGIRFS
jgi:hypothetical protein